MWGRFSTWLPRQPTALAMLGVPPPANAPNHNGFSYILSNFQHPGEDRGSPFGSDPLANYKGNDKAEVLAAINEKWNDRKKVAIGYIGTKPRTAPCRLSSKPGSTNPWTPRLRSGVFCFPSGHGPAACCGVVHQRVGMLSGRKNRMHKLLSDGGIRHSLI